MSGCQNCLAFLPCAINKLAVCKVHCVCCSKWKIGRKSLWCVCVPQWPWVELQLINSIDDVALALLFFCSQFRAWTWETFLVSSPIPGRRRQDKLAVQRFYRGGGESHPHTSSHSLFIHHSFAVFIWSTGWKFNLMTCLQARNMILKPVTVKQRCHLHNDPSKIGLQPLPWQLVDRQKNGDRALWMDGKLRGRWFAQFISMKNGPGFLRKPKS